MIRTKYYDDSLDETKNGTIQMQRAYYKCIVYFFFSKPVKSLEQEKQHSIGIKKM